MVLPASSKTPAFLHSCMYNVWCRLLVGLLLSSLLLADLGLIIVHQILWLVAFVATVLLGADLGLLVGVASAVVVIVGKTAL